MSSRRHVRELRIRATRSDEVPRAAILISDALHTATIPDAEDSRLVFIRRLDIGKIRLRHSSATLARQIEQVVRETAVSVVDAASPAATEANVVAFPNRIAAYVTLTRRMLREHSIHEWFWSRLIPGWSPALSKPEALRQIWKTAATHEIPLLALTALAECAFREQHGDVLTDVVPANAVSETYVLLGWQNPGAQPSRSPLPRLESALRTAARRVETQCRHLAANDPRRVLWTALLTGYGRESLAEIAHLPALTQSWISENQNRATRRSTDTSVSTFDAPLLSERESRTDNSPRFDDSDQQPAGSPKAPDVLEPIVFNTPSFAHESTRFGGLLFLVRALERLGFPSWLNENPASLQPGSLLLDVATSLGMKRTDALFPALHSEESDVNHGDQPSLTPPSTFAASLLSQRPPRQLPHSPTELWRLLLRRFLRRHVRIGLWNLVVRPAEFIATPTHIDFFFGLDQIDTRIRRAGLDIDPGWVSWLGKVVRFHFGAKP